MTKNKKPKLHSDILIDRLRRYINQLDDLKAYMEEDIEALIDSQKRKRFKKRMTPTKSWGKIRKELLH